MIGVGAGVTDGAETTGAGADSVGRIVVDGSGVATAEAGAIVVAGALLATTGGAATGELTGAVIAAGGCGRD